MARTNTVGGVTVGRWSPLSAAQVHAGATPEQHLSLIQNLLHGYYGVEVDAAVARAHAGPTAFLKHSPTLIPPSRRWLGRPARRAGASAVTPAMPHRRIGARAGRERPRYVERAAAGLSLADAASPPDRPTSWPTGHASSRRWRLRAGATETAEASRPRPASTRQLPAGQPRPGLLRLLPAVGHRALGEPGGGDASLVAHDFSHVLAGYDPDAPGELAPKRCSRAPPILEHHFSGLVAPLGGWQRGGKVRHPRHHPTIRSAEPPRATPSSPGLPCSGAARAAIATSRPSITLAPADEPLGDVQADRGPQPERPEPNQHPSRDGHGTARISMPTRARPDGPGRFVPGPGRAVPMRPHCSSPQQSARASERESSSVSARLGPQIETRR